MRVGARRQPAAQPAHRAVGVAADSTSALTDSCGGQRRRAPLRRAASRSASSASTSAAQSVDVVGVRRLDARRAAIALAHQRGPAVDVAAPRARRIGGPDRLDHACRATGSAHRRQARAPTARRRRTGRRPSADGVDDVLDLAEELRRPARLGLGGAPVVTGQQQRVLGAGERHVQQPALLVDATLIERALVLGDLVGQRLSDRSRRRCRAPARRARAQVARSPRSSGGRSAASVSQVRATRSTGNTRPLRCGTATTCHSSPLAACTVRICTRSCATVDLGGREPVLHRPSAASRKASRSAPSRRAARPRSRPPRRRTRRGVRCRASPPTTGCAARTSASTPSTRRTSATSRAAGVRAGRAARSARGPARRSADGPPASSGRGGPDRRWRRPGRRRRRRARPAATICVGRCATPSAPPTPSSSTARRHSAAMSRPPSRQRGPVSTRIAAAPAVGSATSRSIATTSATSGTASRPASPTTSTGTPRAVSASAIGAASALRRTSTAAVGTAAPASRAPW